jgi:hypothetical protein
MNSYRRIDIAKPKLGRDEEIPIFESRRNTIFDHGRFDIAKPKLLCI